MATKVSAIAIGLQAKQKDVKKISEILKGLTKKRIALINVVTNRTSLAEASRQLKRVTKPVEVKVKPVIDREANSQVQKIKNKLQNLLIPVSKKVTQRTCSRSPACDNLEMNDRDRPCRVFHSPATGSH